MEGARRPLSEQSPPLGGPPAAAPSRAQAPGLTDVCLETEVTVCVSFLPLRGCRGLSRVPPTSVHMLAS